MAKEIVKRSYRQTVDLLQLESVYSLTLWFSILESSFMSFVKGSDFFCLAFFVKVFMNYCVYKHGTDRQKTVILTKKKLLLWPRLSSVLGDDAWLSVVFCNNVFLVLLFLIAAVFRRYNIFVSKVTLFTTL